MQICRRSSDIPTGVIREAQDSGLVEDGAQPTRMGVLQERRKRCRLDLHLDVRLQTGSDATARTLEGKTQNISTDGFYCILRAPLTPGDWIKCIVTIPLHHPVRGESDLCLSCDAQVVRVEQADAGQYGVACRIDNYTIMNLAEA